LSPIRADGDVTRRTQKHGGVEGHHRLHASELHGTRREQGQQALASLT